MKHLKMIIMLLLTVAVLISCEEETTIAEDFVVKEQLFSRSLVLDDADGDGCLDAEDTHLNSNMSETIIIDGCDTAIENILVDCGTTMMDQITDLVEEIALENIGKSKEELHKKFMRKLAGITYYWRKDRLVSRSERSKISDCAWESNFSNLIVLLDRDGDGYVKGTNLGALGGDCDDTNSNINPGAEEIFTDDIDNNCNGVVGYIETVSAPCESCMRGAGNYYNDSNRRQGRACANFDSDAAAAAAGYSPCVTQVYVD